MDPLIDEINCLGAQSELARNLHLGHPLEEQLCGRQPVSGILDLARREHVADEPPHKVSIVAAGQQGLEERLNPWVFPDRRLDITNQLLAPYLSTMVLKYNGSYGNDPITLATLLSRPINLYNMILVPCVTAG